MRPEPSARTRGDLAALLRTRREELVRQWTRRVLNDPRVPEANRLSEPELRDHIPMLIDRIAAALDAEDEGEVAGRASDVRSGGRSHARQRLANEYSLREALSELSQFRAAILELSGQEGVPLETQAAQCLNAAVDQSMIAGSDEMERAAVEKLRQEAVFRERFIGVLGHDLRNPLQTIKLVAATLLTREDRPEEERQLVRRITTSVDRMTRMIADLLEVTRARLGGGIPVDPKPADLSAICRQAIDEMQIARPGRALRLDVQGDALGEWDPDRMAQVLSNLLGNALDYSPADTPVHVVVRGGAAEVCVAINNRGSTIAPEVVDQLFEPFVQGSQGGRVAGGQGLGLGLFIAHQIVAAHGGSIDVASTPEEGTTFTVRLPRRRSRARPR